MHAAGMPIIETLRSATMTNAQLLGMENELGQLKEGFIADIVAVGDNPLENVNTLEEVSFVMKEGVVYKQ